MQVRDAGTLPLLITFLAAVLTSQYQMCRAGELCNVAQNRCMGMNGCSLALSNYFISCGNLIHGETTNCSTRCRRALISLLMTDERNGDNLLSCDCDGNKWCESHRNRIEVCSKDVLEAMPTVHDATTPISCSLAEQICRADSQCLTALEFYQRNCRQLWRGERCSKSCNNSLAILYKQPNARKLPTCICDGTEDFPVACETMKSNVNRLCLVRANPHRHQHGTSQNDTRGHSRDYGNSHHDFEANNFDVNAQYSSDVASTARTLLHPACWLLTLLICLAQKELLDRWKR